MDFENLAHNWDQHAKSDPMWAVLMDPERDLGRWDPREFFETGQADIAYALHAIRRLGFPLQRTRALDFGCGLGRLSQALACYFDRVDGVDVAPAMVKQAIQLNPYGERCKFHLNPRDDWRCSTTSSSTSCFRSSCCSICGPTMHCVTWLSFFACWRPADCCCFSSRATTASSRLATTTRRAETASGRGSKPSANDGWGRQGPRRRRATCRSSNRNTRTNLQLAKEFVPGIRRHEMHDGPQGPHSSGPQPKRSQDVAITELHLIPRRKMLRYIKRHGGKVLKVVHRVEATPHHPSYRYFVTK